MIIIGCSGWQYRDWRESFYPRDVPQRLWLEYYARVFRTVEVNNTFYMLPKPSTFEAWAARTPDDFVVTVKMSRYLTHIKRLREPEEPVERFMSHARLLGDKLGPILLQFPPTLQRDTSALAHTLDLLARHEVRVAVEFRHDSWFVEEIHELLAERDVALSWADRLSRPVAPTWRTATWGYHRLHQGRATPSPCYGAAALHGWAERIAAAFPGGEDVYVYFNNDPNASAVRDAILSRACRGMGLEATRVPEPDEVTVLGEPVPRWPAWFS